MSSVADIPSEARCKQLVYELVTKQKLMSAASAFLGDMDETMAGAETAA